MLDGKTLSSFWLRLLWFPCHVEQGMESKANGKYHPVSRGRTKMGLQPKCGDGQDTEGLKNQSHTSAATLRMEKELLRSLLLFVRKEGAITWERLCAFGVGTGSFNKEQHAPYYGREGLACQ